MRWFRAWRVALIVGSLTSPAFAGWEDPDAGRSPLTVFGPRDFGTQGFNWSVVADKRGRLFVGNDQVLLFDGRTWSSLPVGRADTVRSLDLDVDGRVWVGANGELGYFEDDAVGQPIYHSLREKVPASVPLGEIWHVHRLGFRTLFTTRDRIFIWDGQKFEVQSLATSERLHQFRVGQEIWVSQPGHALWRFDGGWRKIEGAGLEKAVFSWGSLLPGGKVLLGSDLGLMKLEQGVLRRIESPANTTLAKATAVTSATLPGGQTCVATLFGGLLFLDAEGQPLRLLSRKTGLPSQGITGLFLQSDGNLWVSGNHVVFRFDARRTTTLFDEAAGFGAGLGRVVGRVGREDLIVVADEGVLLHEPAQSWQGLAQFSRIPALDRSFLAGYSPQPDRYWLAGGRELTEISPFGVRPLRSSTADLFQLEPGPRGKLYALEGTDVVELAEEDGLFPEARPLLALKEPATDLQWSSPSRLWVATATSGLIALDSPWEEQPPRRDFTPGLELPTTFHRPLFFRIAHSLYAYSGTTLLRLGEGRPRPLTLARQPQLLQFTRSGATEVWGLARWKGEAVRLVRVRESADGPVLTPFPERLLRAVGQPVRVLQEPGSDFVWVSGSDGILRVDTKWLETENPAAAPRLLRVKRLEGERSEWLPLRGPLELPFSESASLQFDFRDPASPPDEVAALEFRLESSASWTRLQGPLVLTGLREGRYRMEVRRPPGAYPAGAIATRDWVVLPPWHRHPWAYFTYFTLGAGSLLGAAAWRIHSIRKLNTELRALVDRRTEELSRATVAKGAFLSNLGHEILNPLNGVIGLVGTLRSGRLDPAEARTAARLATCAEQLVTVVEDLLEYSRLEAGQASLRLRPFALEEPVEAALDLFRAVQAPGSGPLKFEALPELRQQRRFGAPDRIRHILINYLSNALKYGAGQPVTVSLALEEPNWVVFSVRDRGPGLAEDEQKSLFHRFQRSAEARRQNIPGTGLGLAVCKAYAEAMGGEVGVVSQPDQGATFFLRLPLRPATPTDSPTTVTSVDLLAGLRVLVLDDHDFNRDVLCDALTRLGAVTVSAAHLSEARAHFIEQSPDLVLADLDLGEESGADFATWVRQHAPTRRDTALIATTAFQLAEVRERCLAAGMDEVITKPLTEWKIHEAMKHLAHRGRAIRRSEAPLPPSASQTGMMDLLAGGDARKKADLVARSQREVRSEAARLVWACRRKQWPEAQKVAHRLISVTILLELSSLTRTLQNLQKQVQQGEENSRVRSVNDLRAALHEVRKAWRADPET